MRADRLLSIMMLLQTRGHITARELAQRLEVSERTIYRDLEALGMAGVPVYTERGPGGGCVLAEGYRTGLTGLTETEVRTLFMSGVPAPLTDLGLGQALEAALLKLLAALPQAHQRNIERARQLIHLDAAAWSYSEETVPHLRTIMEAVWQDRKLRLIYRKTGGEVSERVVEPLGLVAKATIWYLVAAVPDGELRVFRVSRIQEAEPTGEFFERSESFDLASYWAEASRHFESTWLRYRTTLRFAPDIISELPFIFGEGITTLIDQAAPPDAGGWITLTLSFESFETARTRVLGLGTDVEVLAPPELRQSVIQFASGIVAFYEQK
ncbi:MAG TPA: YafY family protein [Ktedonobacteraceae bacterium]|nr:YafY family protein [Ktedonobacteraceae bacterium]